MNSNLEVNKRAQVWESWVPKVQLKSNSLASLHLESRLALVQNIAIAAALGSIEGERWLLPLSIRVMLELACMTPSTVALLVVAAGLRLVAQHCSDQPSTDLSHECANDSGV